MKKKILTCKRGLILCLVLTVSGILVGMGAIICMVSELSDLLMLGLWDLLGYEAPQGIYPADADVFPAGLKMVDVDDADDILAAAMVGGVALLGALLSGLVALVLSFFVGKPAEASER
ncbi:MAG: hypothetical protein IKJ58_07320 [Akkermansia sp.]|nr:hypothetical protein [Akkermansia sp.]